MAKPLIQAFVGTAGWTIPKAEFDLFPAEGTHLERYSQVLPGVEINSSFYRPHQRKTYERWAQSTPDQFRFAVKVPKTITHVSRLANTSEMVNRFVDEASGLGSKLGPLLVQLPPSLKLEAGVATRFFTMLRERFEGEVACEPRHISWFCAEAEQLFQDFHIARVAADPALVSQAAKPGGWNGFVYYRLHGSPRMYYSDYPADYLNALIEKLRLVRPHASAWCIFDNTAEFKATGNALHLLKGLEFSPSKPKRE